MVKKSSTTVLFDSNSEVKKSAAKLRKAGRTVKVEPTSHPDGTGPCGLLCSCQNECKNKGAYPGDNGSMVGTGY